MLLDGPDRKQHDAAGQRGLVDISHVILASRCVMEVLLRSVITDQAGCALSLPSARPTIRGAALHAHQRTRTPVIVVPRTGGPSVAG